LSVITDNVDHSDVMEFVARATETDTERPFRATIDLQTFMRRIMEATGTSGAVTTEKTLTSALALRAPVRVAARRPARTLATASAAPDLVAVSSRLVNVDHRNRVRLKSALRGMQLPQRLHVLELGDGFAVLGLADAEGDGSHGVQLKLDSQERLLLTQGVAHRLGVGLGSRQLLVAGDDASHQVALVHLGALLVKARQAHAAEATGR
jgi:hypothetical protein